MDYPCGIIQDLLPSYLEGVCSPETEETIKQHLSQCEDCHQYFSEMQEENSRFEHEMAQLEKWGILWMLREFFDGFKRHYRMVWRGVAVLAVAGVVLTAGYHAWQGLTQADCIPVSSKDYQIEKVMQLQDGDIFCSYYVRYHSTFTHHYVITDNIVYFPAMRPVLDQMYSTLEKHGGCWIMNPDSVWDENNQTYISVEAICLGNPDDCILIWQRDMDLPVASSEEQAWIESADWTIF